jgi:putative hemolysin
MQTNFKITLFFILVAILISACSQKSTPTATPTANDSGLANPASVNCLDQGGKLEMRDRGELGQYGICVFEYNLQCEEWAMFRGECPVGGIDISGYATQAAVFCAISGGEYAVSGNNGATDELGVCTLKDNTSCDVWDYYNGICPGNQ